MIISCGPACGWCMSSERAAPFVMIIIVWTVTIQKKRRKKRRALDLRTIFYVLFSIPSNNKRQTWRRLHRTEGRKREAVAARLRHCVMNGLRVVVISAECAKGGKTSNRRSSSRYNAVRGYMVQLYAGAIYIDVKISHCGTLRNGQTKEWRKVKKKKKKKNSGDADDDGERERFVWWQFQRVITNGFSCRAEKDYRGKELCKMKLLHHHRSIGTVHIRYYSTYVSPAPMVS